MTNTIFILDKNQNIIDVLSNNGDSPKSPFFDDKYIQDLNTGAETFEFTTVSNDRTNKYLVAGCYVAFKYNNKIKMFQVIETNEDHEEALYKTCYCEVAGLELINSVVRHREIASANIRQFMENILADTEWKLGIVDLGVTDVHTINIDKANSVYNVIQSNLDKYNIEIEYRVLMSNNKVSGRYIDVYRQRGRATKKRFEYGINVSGVSKTVDMSELCTAIIGTGANNIDFKSVEGEYPVIKPLNQDFVADEEAYKIWNNNGFHITGVFSSDTESPHELLKLTWNELQRRKQPKFTYDIKTEMIYGDENEVSIGDTVFVIDNDYAPALHLSARVGKLEISFTDYTKNKCVLTNFKDVKSGVLSLETIQAIINGKFPITSDSIADGAITDGKIDTQYLTTIKADVIQAGLIETEKLVADKANIKDLTAINATIENLKVKDADIENAVIENATVTNATIEKLTAEVAIIENAVIENATITNAQIENLKTLKADIIDLNATNATIEILKATIATIDTLLAGNLAAKNIQANSITANEMATGTITAGSGVIANGAIGSAQISSLDAGKVNAGVIDTSRVTIAGANGNLKITGNRLQVFEGIGATQKERVSLGDVNGDGTIYGLRVRGVDGKTILLDENGVKPEGITNGSISDEKIADDAYIDGSKLNINSVVTSINGATTTINGTKIDIDGTNLSVKMSSIDDTVTEQADIIAQQSSEITANTSSIKLKVDTQTYTTDKTNMTNTLNKATSDINVINGQIALKVEKTDITNAINDIEVGGRNLLKNSNVFGLGLYQGSKITSTEDVIIEELNNKKATKLIISGGTNVIKCTKGDGQFGVMDTKYVYSVWVRNDGTTDFKISTNGVGEETTIKAGELRKVILKGVGKEKKNLQFNFSTLNISDEIRMTLAESKIEIGTKVTDWSPAPEDVDSNIDTKVSTAKGEIKITTDAITQNVSKLATTVETKADGTTVTNLSNKVGSLETSVDGIKGEVSSLETTTTTLKNDVNKAQADANTAQTSATTANSKLNDIASDSKLTATEKQSVKLEWDKIVGEKDKIVADANQYSQSTTAYTTAYNTLNTYVTPLLANLTTTSDIVGATFRTNFTNYYNARQDLLNAISTKAKVTADATQTGLTTLQGEVTTVKSNVATLDINLNGITQRVSSTETNVSTVTTTANNAMNKANTNTSSIATTNSKVSTIETNLGSITSRVGNVETKQNTTDGKVTSLETRVTTAESKITDDSITNTVKKNFYTKGETETQITSKGYQTNSQVQQLVDKLEIKFEESGGYNRVKNGQFKYSYNNWVDWGVPFSEQSIGIDNHSNGVKYVRFTTKQNNQGMQQTIEGLDIGKKYTFSATCEPNTGVVGMIQVYNKDGFINSRMVGDGKSKRLTVTFVAKDVKCWIYLGVGEWVENKFGILRFWDVQFEDGEIATPIAPNPNEVYDGITTIDKDGIKITNSNSDTYTQIDSSSFSVNNNNGGTIAEFSRNSFIPNLESSTIIAERIIANNVASVSPTSSSNRFIYVDGATGNDLNTGESGSRLKTVQKAIDILDDVINTNTTIYVYNSVPGFELKGKTGCGVISFSFQDSCIVNSMVTIAGVTNSLWLANESQTKKAVFKGGIKIDDCATIELYCLTFRGLNQHTCNIYAKNVRALNVNNCDLGGLSETLGCAIKPLSTSMWMHDCIGSNINDIVGLYAFTQLYMPRRGTFKCPDYKNGLYVQYDGGERNQIFEGCTFTKTPSSGWNPAYTPSAKTQQWNFNKIWSEETSNKWGTKNELIQGRYDGWATGQWTGYMQMTDDFAGIRSVITGASNLKGRIYIQRRTTSGNSTGSKLCLYTSDGTQITTFRDATTNNITSTINTGQAVWGDLDSSIITRIMNGAIKYFYLKADGSNSSTYFKCESNAKIEITYTK